MILLSFCDTWNPFIQHELRLAQVFDLRLPKNAEFLIHLIEEELLLSSLPAQLVFHLQPRLLHNRVKKLQLCSVSLLMILLKLLDALDLIFGLEVAVPLGDLFFYLLGNVEESFVSFLNSLLTHQQIVLNLLHKFLILRPFHHKGDSSCMGSP